MISFDQQKKKSIKLMSIIETALFLVLILVNLLLFTDAEILPKIEYKYIIQIQDRFYDFASGKYYKFFALELIGIISYEHCVNAIFAFLYSSYSPFLGLMFAILFNFFVTFNNAFNLLIYSQANPAWVFSDVKSTNCTEYLAGSSTVEFTYSFLLVLIILILSKFRIIEKLIFKLLIFLVFLCACLLFALNSIALGLSFPSQLLTGFNWGVLCALVIHIYNSFIIEYTFKLGFVIKKANKWKIYSLTFCIILYFFFIMLFNMIDVSTLIPSEYMKNYFVDCKFDSYISINIIQNTTILMNYILVIPTISFASSNTFSRLRTNWFKTSHPKCIFRGFLSGLIILLLGTTWYTPQQPSDFFIRLFVLRLLPLLFSIIIAYSFVPRFCNRLGLCNNQDEKFIKVEEIKENEEEWMKVSIINNSLLRNAENIYT